MIRVVYHRTFKKVSIEGHAFSGEPGHDLVCAAASTLAYTLANTVENMSAANQCKDKKISLEIGKAFITCRPVLRYTNTVTLLFDTLCSGFALLAHNYPENISYEVRG